MIRRPVLTSALSSLAAILILAAGCGEQNPTSAALQPSGAAAARDGVKARVVTSHYAAGTYFAVIGPDGGTLDFGIGSLVVPAGAVTQPTRISAFSNGSDVAVDFQPHGLTFTSGHEPTLWFDLGNAPDDNPQVEIQYLDDAGFILEKLPSQLDATGLTVSAQIRHFSPYAAGIGS